MTDKDYSVVGRVRHLGVHSCSLLDLCAIGFSRREDDADNGLGMARNIADRLPNLIEAGDIAFDLLKDESGIDGFEALRCKSLIEIGRRAGLANKGDMAVVEEPRDVAEMLAFLVDEKREHFYAVLLNSANEVMRKALIHIGTLTMSIVGPREIFREAVREGASTIIVAHNHPSGDPTPSPEDIEVTKQLVQAGKLLDIPVLDHIIIGRIGGSAVHESSYRNRQCVDFRSLSQMGLM